MRKNISNDMPFDIKTACKPEESSAREALLKENAVLFDYLHALLTPPPKMNIEDSGKVSVVYSEPEKEPNSSSTNLVVENFINLESTWAKGGSQELKHENDFLKLKVAHLIAQLNDTECNLDSLLAENRRMKSTIDNLQTQLKISRLIAKSHRDISRIKVKAATLHDHEDLMLVGDQMKGKEIEPAIGSVKAPVPCEIASAPEDILELEPIVQEDPVSDERVEKPMSDSASTVPQIMTEAVSDSIGKPELEAVAQKDAASYQVKVTLSDSAIVAPKPMGAGRTGSVVEPDRAAVSPAPVSVKATQKASQEAVTPVKQDAAILRKPAQKTRPTSKVIKSRELSKQPAVEAADQVLTAILQPTVHQSKADAEQNPIPVTEPETTSEAEPASNKEMLQPGVAGTGTEPAPIPKALVKRQMMHYKQNQDEADSTEVSTAHDIIRL